MSLKLTVLLRPPFLNGFFDLPEFLAMSVLGVMFIKFQTSDLF